MKILNLCEQEKKEILYYLVDNLTDHHILEICALKFGSEYRDVDVVCALNNIMLNMSLEEVKHYVSLVLSQE